MRTSIAQSPEAQALIAQIAGAGATSATLAALTATLAAGGSLSDLPNQVGSQPPKTSVAETPFLTVQAASADQGSTVSLSIAASQAAANLSTANLTVTITDLAGATLNQGTLNADGSYTLEASDLLGLVLTPREDLAGVLALSVSVSASDTEPTSDTSATSAAQTLDVIVNPIALAPLLVVGASSGNEGSPIGLTISASQATSALPSADLSVTVSGLQGATLNHGTLNPDGSYTLKAGDLTGLRVTPSPGFSGSLQLSVSAIDTETASQTMATSAVQSLDVTVAPIVATPPATPIFNLAASDQSGTIVQPATASSAVTLTGATTPGDTVTLVATGATTVASTDGAFQFDNVSLAQGANTLTVSASNGAAQTSSFSLTIDKTVTSTTTNPVLEWNQTTLNAVALDADAASVASRSLAIESLAVYDTVSAINGTPGYLLNETAPADASVAAAVDEAADQALDALYPGQAAVFDAELSTDLAAIPDDQPKTDGIALGQTVAQAIIALRANDSSSDNVVDNGSDAVGQWRPTGPGYGAATTPQWATLEPFALESADQYQPPPPPDESSAAYAASIDETESLGASNSTTRTADETQIAKFWNDQTGTDTPAGAWNSIATSAAVAQGDSLSQDAQLLAELNVAEGDAGIAAWNAKYTYNAWRPITAIQNADETGNSAITQDPTWEPLLTTPSFPEYVAGQAVFSAAAAQVLDSFFGDNYAFTATSESLAGVTRSFTSFDEAALEAGMSRVYGGIHFSFSVDGGETVGQEVGDWTLQVFNDTTDTTPPKITLNQASGLVTNADPTITGEVTDNLSGVASLAVSIDGATAIAVSYDSNGNFSVPLTLPTDGTADGAHTLDFVAVDAAGNATTPLEFDFTLATQAPQITLAATGIQNGGTLATGLDLTGAVSVEAGDTITALSYAFDGGAATPVAYDAGSGAFDQPLDLSTLITGAHTLTLTALDAAGDSTTTAMDVSLPSLPPLTITALTPAMSAGDVGVTYHPEVTFSRAVNPATLTASSFYATDTTGAVVPATIVPVNNGLSAYLFFANPLPGASTITLHVGGSTIAAQSDGALLDAAGSGTPGSDLSETFTTVSTAGILNTTISGIVVDPGPDDTPYTIDDVKLAADGISDFANDTWKLPIAGVKVYVLGQEQNAVYTDATGHFTLTNVPVGDVKVVIDGLTATNDPAGYYFPTMTLDTTIRPGINNTLMASMGTLAEQQSNAGNPAVYLPRVADDVLKTLSATAPTVITAPADSDTSAGNLNLSAMQLSQLSLTVQPGSLVDENGNAVANPMVGISVVPPAIVQDMLPAGLLQHTFDITIQAPAGVAFAQPATLTLPNVFGLAPGLKTYILSFDHTTGRLVIDGTGTVSADGTTVTSDPGSGITAPGWHGYTPAGSMASNSPPDTGCNVKGLAWDTGLSLAKNAIACGKDFLKNTAGKYGDAASQIVDIIAQVRSIYNTVTAAQEGLANGLSSSQLNEYASVLQAGCAAVADAVGAVAAFASTAEAEAQTALDCTGSAVSFATDACNAAVAQKCFTGAAAVVTCSLLNVANTLTAQIQAAIDAFGDKWKVAKASVNAVCSTVALVVNELLLDSANSKSASSPSTQPGASDMPVLASAADNIQPYLSSSGVTQTVDLTPAGTTSNAASSGDLASDLQTLSGQAQQSLSDATDASTALSTVAAIPVPNPDAMQSDFASLYEDVAGAPANAYYLVVYGTEELRGQTGSDGSIGFFLPPATAYTLYIYDIKTGFDGFVAGITSASGSATALPAVFVAPDTDPVLADGLTATQANIVGVDPKIPDNLVSGVTDIAALQEALANGAITPSETGVVASLSLKGSADAIVLDGSSIMAGGATAYLATGSYGVAIVDVSNPRQPTVLSQLPLTGSATDVDVDPTLQLVAIADGSGGLDIVDVATPSTPSIAVAVPIDATAVRVFEGIAYANDGSTLNAIDLTTGDILQRLTLTGQAITAIVREGTMLYTMDAGKTLTAFNIGTGLLVKEGTITLAAGGGQITVADGVVYVPTNNVFSGDYTTVDVSNAAQLKVIANPSNAGIESGAIALNGSGIGVTVGKDGGGSSGIVAVDIVNTSDPETTGAFITRYALPVTGGDNAVEPFDVAIADGTAFVAAGSSGLEVVNYLPIDTAGVPPTVTISQGPIDTDPNTPGIQVTEGSVVTLQATITDDVQVRDVAVLVNGQVVSDSVSFPWDLSAALPTIAANGSDQATIQLQATDTGGNVTITNPIIVTLVPDTTAPVLQSENIAAGQSYGQSFRSFSFTFSKPLDPATVSAANFELMGPGGVIVAPQTVQLVSRNQVVRVTYAALPFGNYDYVLNAPDITDVPGTILAAATLSTSFTIQAFSTSWVNAKGGSWSLGANWSTGAAPVATDDAFINLAQGQTVTYSTGTLTLPSLTYVGGGTLAVSGGSLTVSTAFALAGELIISGGTFAIGADTTLSGGLSETAGALDVNATVTETGNVAMTYGTVVIAAGQSLIVSGAASLGATSSLNPTLEGPGSLVTTGAVNLATQPSYADLSIGDGANWTNAGTVTDAGQIRFGLNDSDTAAFVNQAAGVFDLTADAAGIAANYYYINASFINAGLLEKTGGNGTSTIAAAITNTGTIAVTSGTLAFSGGGTIGGILTASGTSTLAFSGGSFTVSTATIAAALLIDDSTLNVTASTTETGTFSVTSGTVAIAAGQSLSVSGATSFGEVNANGATLEGPGSLVTTGAVSLATQQYGESDLYIGDGATWTNSGTVTDSGLIYLGLKNADTEAFANQAAGVFDLTTDTAGITAYYSSTATFTNAGLLEKTGGTGTSIIAAAITNTGTIAVTSGTLALQGDVGGAGAIDIGASVVLDFEKHVATGTTISFIASGGSLQIDGGSAFAGNVAGFSLSDQIDLTTLAYGASSTLSFTANSQGLLATVASVSGSMSIQLLGSLQASDLHITGDGHGGTVILHT